ncbi:regulator of chromosome condensation 1/beta-lactamase-inhibitor protein II [Mycena metata]|uniref:Regulator of chromosome condensation 1/beta-lactamase-inhibitor protein II n=1 Tax=Mycena metata TaxID=1033252 RepID=A0AAD7JDU5_9AGAR|nr:regulator of chromosome condensation 1/beta-lactamase-inhibitor protein II [Mycena metata]
MSCYGSEDCRATSTSQALAPPGSAGSNLYIADSLTPKSLEKNNGRLGLGTKFPKSNLHGVPFPTQLRIPSARVVNIVSGGMSFHALDSEGSVYVWGKTAPSPLRLELPSRIREVSCGRLHACALDAKSKIWTFTSWGRPFTLFSRHLLRDSRPVQVECGWDFTSLLTKSGEVFAFWPRSGTMKEQIEAKNASLDEDSGRRFLAKATDGVIPCLTTTGDDVNAEREIKIIKIAALDGYLIALTNQGHVVLFSGLENENTFATGRWKYVNSFSFPNFSELDRVRSMSPFTPTDESPGIVPPQTMKITHISAHFYKFFVYSTGASSVVLMGDTDTTEETDPHIDPALQDKSVISVLVGDWHNAALTSSGKLLTWGRYSAGALGLGDPTTLTPGQPGAFATQEQRLGALDRGFGDPPETTVPTEVRFDHARKTPKDRFCFSACAAGWQTGALVIDLQPDAEDEESEEELVEEPGSRIRRLGARSLPMQPPYGLGLPMGGAFRIGFAGRGATRARGRGM